jgi:CheY-like chemotaxis protein
LLAKNGEEAVQIYAENHDRIDLLLFDIVMPRMGGVEAYRRIKDSCRGGDIPLIFMTGYSSETVQTQFGKQKTTPGTLGAPVVQKPYNVPALGHKVREVLDTRPKSERLKSNAR